MACGKVRIRKYGRLTVKAVIAFVFAIVPETTGAQNSGSLEKWGNDVSSAASAYYECVRTAAGEMALAAREPAEIIAKGAKASCNNKRSSLIDLLSVGITIRQLTDLGEAKLLEEADNQAANRAIAAVIAARAGEESPTPLDSIHAKALEKDQSDKAEAMANCATANADEMALASSEPAETIAKGAVALCWKEVRAFTEADARTVGRAASPTSIMEAERIVSDQLVPRVIAARAAAARAAQHQQETPSVPAVRQRDF